MSNVFFSIGKIFSGLSRIVKPADKLWRMVYTGYCAGRFKSFAPTSRTRQRSRNQNSAFFVD